MQNLNQSRISHACILSPEDIFMQLLYFWSIYFGFFMPKTIEKRTEVNL